jgi:hypothetical protein
MKGEEIIEEPMSLGDLILLGSIRVMGGNYCSILHII